MENGYLAITSAIILSIIAMVLAVGLSFSSYFGLSDIQDANLKETSVALAEACVDKALLSLAQNINYTGNEIIAVGSSTCSILPTEISSTYKIIKTGANFSGAVTNLKITAVTSSPFEILKWEEY
ncbi:MAG: hypothetical protein AAB496_00235 [Patescibacteria group bacterium]